MASAPGKVNLSKIVAVEKGVKARTDASITSAYHKAQQAPAFVGLSRSYQPKNDDGDKLPDENQVIQTNPFDLIRMFSDAQVTFADVIATKDWGNTEAKADVVVDGLTLIKDVPVTYLLFLEKKLVDVKTFINSLPTLSPTEKWLWDETNGVWATEPAGTAKTAKVPDVQVLYEATDKHPAQVQPFNRDVVQGTWTTIKYSSALPPTEIATLQARVTKVLEAVKFAREEANMYEAAQQHVAQGVFDYIFPPSS